MALSIISYCSKIWDSTNKTQLQRIQKLQNFAARIALDNVKKYDRITPHINKLNWLKIENKYAFDICLYVFKILNKHLPSWLLTLPLVMEYNNRRTRQQYDLYIPSTRTIMGDRKMSVRGPRLWNNLPEEVKICCMRQHIQDKSEKAFHAKSKLISILSFKCNLCILTFLTKMPFMAFF